MPHLILSPLYPNFNFVRITVGNAVGFQWAEDMLKLRSVYRDR